MNIMGFGPSHLHSLPSNPTYVPTTTCPSQYHVFTGTRAQGPHVKKMLRDFVRAPTPSMNFDWLELVAVLCPS